MTLTTHGTQAYDQSRSSTATPMQSPPDVNMATPGSASHRTEANETGCGLGANIDVLVCRAEWYYHVGAYQVAEGLLPAFFPECSLTAHLQSTRYLCFP